jgi:pyridinium-3,5-bisthiocarboxylic acid mononucleotide nickel chelatase
LVRLVAQAPESTLWRPSAITARLCPEKDVVQIHVDPLGGWSGDMFVAACLDACPALWPEVRAAIEALKLGPDADLSLESHSDGVLTGRRFTVAAESGGADATLARHDAHGREHSSAPEHDRHRHAHGRGDGPNRAWTDIRAFLATAALDRAVAAHATGIFALLAKAEAEAHGIDEQAVTFHEIGAVDSLVDIVAAALMIARLSATRWSAGPLPLGGGRVKTAHGLLPVPAPATALLMRGLPTIDDGIQGERVTPTGAAVARYLLDAASRHDAPRTMRAVGTGFGARTFPGVSNCLRVLLFDEVSISSPATSPILHEEVGVIEFEIDDQSPEDLSLGLDNLRALEGVLDVVQSALFGKRGRVAVQVRILAAPRRLDEVVRACFLETATIGLRHHLVRRALLARLTEEIEVDGQRLRVKTAMRPDGQATAKVEAVDLAAEAGRGARSALSRAGEAAALARLSSKRLKTGE